MNFRLFVMAPLAVLALCSTGQADELTTAERAQIAAAEKQRIDAIESVYGAVVAIYGNDRQGGGSGVLFHPAGYALTNHHVVDGAGAEGWGGLADGRLYRWKLVGTDPGGDVAIIRLAGKSEFPFAPLGDSSAVRVGDWAMAMGNPFLLAEDQRPTVTLGVVSGVERFQPEAGGNMLLYGNCIQVDSSINPGNSGGPLFNLRGEIIGINGRGSFQDRGRVNVGLGYAISSNQIANFLPELLATKVAQHGTLDAVFADRQGGVLCESINLDAPAAAAGLALGDRLIEFEGRPIRSANQFLNLLSILPAEWPAHLVLERDGKRFEVHTRLLALPYQAPPRPMPPIPMPRPMPPAPMPIPMPGGEPERPEPPAPEYPEPPPPEQPSPESQPPLKVAAKVEVTIDNPGRIRDEEVSAEVARMLLADVRRGIFGDASEPSPKAWRLVDRLREDAEERTEERTLEQLIVSDGRFRVESRGPGGTSAWGFDGAEYWAAPAGDAPRTITPLKALREPLVRQAAILAALTGDSSLASLGKVLLDGADQAAGKAAYRLKITDDRDDWFYLWLAAESSASGVEGISGFRLIKAGPNLDGDGAFPYLVFSTWRDAGGAAFPEAAIAAAGLAEREVYATEPIARDAIELPEDSRFQRPAAAP